MSEQLTGELSATQLAALERAFQELVESAAAKPADVAFGPRDDDKMPHSWAERGLIWLKANRQQAFADMMLAIVATDVKTTTRGSK